MSGTSEEKKEGYIEGVESVERVLSTLGIVLGVSVETCMFGERNKEDGIEGQR